MNEKRIRIALLMDKSGRYDRGLIRGIIKYSNLSSLCEFFLEAPDYTSKDEKNKLIRKLIKWKPDCIVMNDSFSVYGFHKLGCPVLVTPSNKKITGYVNIIAENKNIGELGAKYFIDKGFRNFAFYGTDHIFWSADRKKAFKETVCVSNLNFFEKEALLGKDWQNNPVKLVSWIKKLPKPIAIMACSDEFGIHLIEAAKTGRIKIPDEIAILGVDNDEFICNLYYPPMSSIDQEPEIVGFNVARHIHSHMKGEKQLPEVIISNTFRVVTRLSTDIIAIDDEQLKKALTFIQEHVNDKQISVNEVVSATCLSRRLLEIRFRKMLNRSILQEIKRIRTDLICNKLIQSNIPVNEIAYSMGFNSITVFSNAFKKEMNMTPVEFRKQFQPT